ncbi:MAG: toll/interleukin-1 receptor domain-containing protein [Acidobacteriota bacterium]|nr:toll/interleukin-1 receptor domain-containing protein [Acidobacteriota bacterium]
MRKKTSLKTDVTGPTVEKTGSPGLSSAPQALVFISHDSRDADLAEEFDNLLRDASGGMLKSFRSSDKKGTAGMEYGDEWYSAIMGKLGTATDVVALLTPHSLDRPWILYEAGVAKGKIGGKVLGLVIGVPFERANTGPFYQFQNCPDDEDALTGLVTQLIRRNPGAEPRPEAVKLQVCAFRERVAALQKKRGTPGASSQPGRIDESAVAKLFEEVKVMFRDLPEKVEAKVQENVGRRRSLRGRMFHPMMFEDLMFHSAAHETPEGEAAAWLMLGSMVGSEIPWLHELAMEMYRATCSHDLERITATRDAARRTLRAISESKPFRHMMREEEDPEMGMMMRHLPEMLEHFLELTEARTASKRPRRGAKGTSPNEQS